MPSQSVSFFRNILRSGRNMTCFITHNYLFSTPIPAGPICLPSPLSCFFSSILSVFSKGNAPRCQRPTKAQFTYGDLCCREVARFMFGWSFLDERRVSIRENPLVGYFRYPIQIRLRSSIGLRDEGIQLILLHVVRKR